MPLHYGWLILFLPFLCGKNLSEEFWHRLCQLKTMEMMYQKIGHQLKHILPNCDFMCIFLQKIKYQNAIYINNVFHWCNLFKTQLNLISLSLSAWKKEKKILLKIRISFLIYFLADKGTYLAKLIKDAKKISLHSSTICNKYIYQHVWL